MIENPTRSKNRVRNIIPSGPRSFFCAVEAMFAMFLLLVAEFDAQRGVYIGGDEVLLA